ncbi:MAG TPA: ADP-ribosylation factor-like protein [Anaeromyxobacter sp.]|nr:ADP-ribosylation factor-like protein [Anaeromyxobacter sp.]
MSTVNPLAREISAKIVYYGPGLSGKTTTLQQIHASVRPEVRGELISLSTEGDRTLFFDFLPLRVEQVRGLTLRLQLYTVPGQVFYDATRKLVLNGADGVVFVADSQRPARDSNAESMSNLETNLGELGIELRQFPLVLQWNKRDLPDVLSVEELRGELNRHRAPEFETVASRGEGVMPTLREITKLVVKDLRSRQPDRPAGGMVLSGGGSELATQIAAAADAGPGPGRPDRGELVGVSFARLVGGGGAAAIARTEQAIAERTYGAAVRGAAQAVADLLEDLPVDESRAAARAALLGLDGREFLRLGRLAQKPDAIVTERDALFALYVLVAASVKAERI